MSMLTISSTVVLVVIATNAEVMGGLVVGQGKSVESLHAIVILDSSITTTMGVSPFTWDGSGSVRDAFVEGRRPPDKPWDVFMLPLLDGFFPALTAEDRIQLWSVSRSIRKKGEFSGSLPDLRSAAREILSIPDRDRFGPAPVWDAVVDATEVLAAVPGRRFILVVSSGMVSGNRVGLDTTIELANKRKVPVWAIQLPWIPSAGPGFNITDSSSAQFVLLHAMFGQDSGSLLKRLSLETGGGVYAVNLKTATLRSRFSEVVTAWRR